MTDDRKAALLAEFIAAYTPPVRREGDVTATDVSRAKGVAIGTACGWLKAQVASGALVSERCYDPDAGRMVTVYREVPK